jgi:hypothetical protein
MITGCCIQFEAQLGLYGRKKDVVPGCEASQSAPFQLFQPLPGVVACNRISSTVDPDRPGAVSPWIHFRAHHVDAEANSSAILLMMEALDISPPATVSAFDRLVHCFTCVPKAERPRVAGTDIVEIVHQKFHLQ